MEIDYVIFLIYRCKNFIIFNLKGRRIFVKFMKIDLLKILMILLIFVGIYYV